MPALEAIRSGRISVVFRRWKKATVKTGSTLRTAIGVLAINDVAVVTPDVITADDANNAGFATHDELLTMLDEHEGTIYRIRVSFGGADPRIALREKASVTDDEFQVIAHSLARMDRAAPDGPWTLKVLRVIDQHPHTRAVELAAQVGSTRAVFKPNVRKLKNLGLTISHDIGYELSPRGKAVLNRLTAARNQ